MSHSTADRVEFAHRAWPAHPLQLAPIRAETRRWLEPLNLSDGAEQALVRAVEEAATNVVQHAYPAVPSGDATSDDATSHDVVELTFWTEDQTVCIEIVDHGRRQPPGAVFDSRCCSRFAIMLESKQTVLIHYDIRGTRVLRSAL
jgi:anti-sigma regulatory factor (Ser/Thr protein kinase)